MNTALLGALAWRFFVMAFLAIGGANAVLPEMHRQVVEVEHWMTDRDFADLYAIASAAPGPNVLIVTLVGWRVAGVLGALASSFAMMVPTSILTYAVFQVWNRFRGAHWRLPVQHGLAAVTAGLVAASAFLLSRAADTSTTAVLLTLATAAMSYRTKLNPLWAFGAAAAIGAVGWA